MQTLLRLTVDVRLRIFFELRFVDMILSACLCDSDSSCFDSALRLVTFSSAKESVRIDRSIELRLPTFPA